MIKKYTRELEIMGRAYGGEAEEMPLTSLKIEAESVLEEVTSYPKTTENDENALKTVAEPLENDQSKEETAIDEEINENEADEEASEKEAESNMTSKAIFSAAVFSGDYTYPVEGARIVIYREDNIYAFLETDVNGATKRITLPSFEKENSLEPDNPDRSVDYFADVFAEGFTPQKGLLVSAVGGSDVFLKVLMVPESERIG